MGYLIGLFCELFASCLSWLPIVASNWLMLLKGGYKGWESIVPFYGQYKICEMAQKKNYFWWLLGIQIGIFVAVIGMLISLFIEMANDSDFPIGMIIWIFILFALSIATLLINIFLNINIAKVFGQNGWFAVGLIFLGVIFKFIIYFDDKIHYVPAQIGKETPPSYQTMNDEKANNQNVETQSSEESQQAETMEDLYS